MPSRKGGRARAPGTGAGASGRTIQWRRTPKANMSAFCADDAEEPRVPARAPAAEPDRRSIHRVDELAPPRWPPRVSPAAGAEARGGGLLQQGVLSPPPPRGTRDGGAAWSSWARYSQEKRRRHVGSCRRRRPGTGAPLELGGEVLPKEAEGARGEDLEPHALAALVLHLHRRRMQGPVRPPRPMHRRQNR